MLARGRFVSFLSKRTSTSKIPARINPAPAPARKGRVSPVSTQDVIHAITGSSENISADLVAVVYL